MNLEMCINNFCMELNIISYDRFFDGEEEIVLKLMKDFNFLFHLRKPNSTLENCKSFMQKIPSNMHKRIILHNHYHLISQFDFKGLHYSTQVRRNIPVISDYTSTSCHSVDELTKLDGIFSQMFISPVFESISKPGYASSFNLTTLNTFLLKARKSKIIALGGINPENIKQIKNSSFDGLAVLGSIWGNNPSSQEMMYNNVKQVIKSIEL